ncbi:hypothetical protein [Domibacillus aminovorans]|uniref:Uncharacterized protein n=1 Tax=Domibacillus aminovorans TaxID=29332 RepID=A0A177LBY3_9BACI|nr:hypothetical protein [Domibacillus aminovorans]OAH63093.1 hypothetical protein AWH49_07060 [Domibacillus aminovorans]
METGHIAFLTHYWYDERFPHYRTVTKAGCIYVGRLVEWGYIYGLTPKWIDIGTSSRAHFDLLGEKQLFILKHERLDDHIRKFQLE